MPVQRPHPSRLRFAKPALWPVALALGLAACTKPGELPPPAVVQGKRPAAAPWQAQLSAPSLADASRRLTDGEDEFVVAAAIAAHEMRRP